MENEILSALIGAISAFIVFVLTTFFDAKKRKKDIQEANKQLEQTFKNEMAINKKSLSVQYVTDKRVDWIYTVRDELSNFISFSFRIEELYRTENEVDKALFSDLCCSRSKSLCQLRLLFNINDKLDNEILKCLNDIVSVEYYSDEDFNIAINKLTQIAKIYLKLEWERVKLEANTNLTEEEIKEKLRCKEQELKDFYSKVNALEECQ